MPDTRLPWPEPSSPTRFRVPPDAVDCYAHMIGWPPKYLFVNYEFAGARALP